MCVGIPMRIVESGPFSAICEGMGRRAEIDMRLVGPQPEGTWLLTFLDAAREVIGADEAAKIVDALTALDLAMQGGTPPEHLFADLIGRTPELPDFLKPAEPQREPRDMHPLIQALADRHGFTPVTEKTLDELAAPLGIAMLTICGDPKNVSESLDLAIVAPEIAKAYRGAITPLVATPEAERHLQMRFGFSLFPALIFLRRGEYLGAITRIRDWSDYMAEIPAILQRRPSQAPQFELARGCGNIAAH